MSKNNGNKKIYNCTCGDAFSTLKEFDKHNQQNKH